MYIYICRSGSTAKVDPDLQQIFALDPANIRAPEKVLGEHLVQLVPRLLQPVVIRRINHEDDCLRALVIEGLLSNGLDCYQTVY